MSGRIVHEILECAPTSLTSLERLVLVALGDAARDGDRTTRGGAGAVDVLAYKTAAAPGSVRNALSTLTRRGLVKPMLGKVGPGLAQQYRISELHEYHRDT